MATRIDLVEDVLPISELRLRAAEVIKKIRETQRPLVITQYGRAVAVLLDVNQFQTLQDTLTEMENQIEALHDRLAELQPEDETEEESASDTKAAAS
nr:type II toxin-antitoxin system Phd/YefM family antitoxin [Ardenticatena sp.]